MKKLFYFITASLGIMALTAQTSYAQSSIELNWVNGPFIDFKNNNVDFDARLRLINDNTLDLQSAGFSASGTIATAGDFHMPAPASSGNSSWLIHTPNNGSGIMYVGHNNKGTTGWVWDYQFRQTHFYAKAATVGTGRLPAGYKFAVNGNMIAREVHVQQPQYWPDYVFDEEYDLMDLNEVSAFIEVNRHLPGVPSAAQVEAEGGFDLGEMNKILLEKIEELTLHTIRQQEQIEALQAQVASK